MQISSYQLSDRCDQQKLNSRNGVMKESELCRRTGSTKNGFLSRATFSDTPLQCEAPPLQSPGMSYPSAISDSPNSPYQSCSLEGIPACLILYFNGTSRCFRSSHATHNQDLPALFSAKLAVNWKYSLIRLASHAYRPHLFFSSSNYPRYTE